MPLQACLPLFGLQSAGVLAHLLLLIGCVSTLLVAAGVLALGDLSSTLSDLPTAMRGRGGLRQALPWPLLTAPWPTPPAI